MNGSPFVRPYISPRSRARLTKALLITCAIVSALAMVLGALELVFPALSPEDEIQDNPGALVVALLMVGLGVFQFLSYIATAVCFLMWLHRSNRNLPSFGTPASNINYSPGWAVGSFFVPFVNLVVPYRAVKELWGNSASNTYLRSVSPPNWFPVWWLFWLLSNIASNISFRMYSRGDAPREVIAIAGMLADALTIIAALFAIAVVEEITRRQGEASTSLEMGQTPSYSYPPPPPTFEARPLAPKDSGSSEFNL